MKEHENLGRWLWTLQLVGRAVGEWMQTRAGDSMDLWLPPEKVIFAATLNSPTALELVARDERAREFCSFVDARTSGEATMYQLAIAVRAYGLSHTEIAIAELVPRCHQVTRGGDA